MTDIYSILQVLWIIPFHLPEGRQLFSRLIDEDFNNQEISSILNHLNEMDETAFLNTQKQSLFQELFTIHNEIIEELLKTDPELVLELKEQLREKKYNQALFQKIQKHLPRLARRLIALGK